MPGSKRGAISKLVRNIPKETVNLQRQLCNSRDAGWKLGGRAGSVRVREQFFSLCISRARANTWSQIFPSGKLPSFDCDSDGGGGDFSPRMAASVTDCSMRSRQWLRRERSAVAKGSWRCYYVPKWTWNRGCVWLLQKFSLLMICWRKSWKIWDKLKL